MNIKEQIFSYLESNKTNMIELQKLLTSIRALAPENDGDGEMLKAQALIKWLNAKNINEIDLFEINDDRVTAKKRPNITVSLEGDSSERTIWIMTHLDVVPAGDEQMWDTDPFEAVLKDGKLFGRGTEDNQQSMVASIFAVLALKFLGIKPAYNTKLLIVADEEVGSQYGAKQLLKEYDLFNKKDLILVPDGGNDQGTMIEIAEKSPLWLKFIIEGIQCHGSMPQLGKNAFFAGSRLVVELAKLERIFNAQDDLFDPPCSTFCPTKKEANVPNVNTIPGKDVFYMDCRILPSEDIESVLNEIKKITKLVEQELSVTINVEIVMQSKSSATTANADIVGKLKKAIYDVYRVDGKLVGIGGGTVAAVLRNKGYECVVWSKIDEKAHMPNEYCLIENMIGDAKVMAMLMLNNS